MRWSLNISAAFTQALPACHACIVHTLFVHTFGWWKHWLDAVSLYTCLTNSTAVIGMPVRVTELIFSRR
jgi:hypothetical protein